MKKIEKQLKIEKKGNEFISKLKIVVNDFEKLSVDVVPKNIIGKYFKADVKDNHLYLSFLKSSNLKLSSPPMLVDIPINLPYSIDESSVNTNMKEGQIVINMKIKSDLSIHPRLSCAS